ncbi:hypothetical protein CPC08DRAFT_771645 [Agrocybe pediades]|nr:hypothetical protein CPC08DRAFT_771645 [Agrocybe pediades]
MPGQDSSTTTPRKSKKLLSPKVSPKRQELVRVLYKSFMRLANVGKSSTEYKSQLGKWCDELLTLDGCKEDVDGLVGRGETLLVKEKFEEAARTFESAFESSGRSDRETEKSTETVQAEQAEGLLQNPRRIARRRCHPSPPLSNTHLPPPLSSRKQAKQAHPDKGGSEAKMALLSEVYDVLSNPELR